jgi:hypothetical protein
VNTSSAERDESADETRSCGVLAQKNHFASQNFASKPFLHTLAFAYSGPGPPQR